MRILLLILALSVSVFPQADWQFVGFGASLDKKEKAVFYFDDTSIVRTKDEIIFKGFFARYTPPDEAKGELTLTISRDYYLFSVIQANCKTFTFSATLQYGRWGFDAKGEAVKVMDKFERDDKPAPDGSMIHKTLRLACSLKPNSKNEALHNNASEPKTWNLITVN